MPVYVIDQSFLFFSHVPKCGGTSVEKSLRKHGREFLLDRGFHAAPESFSRCSAQHLHRAAIARIFPEGMFDFEFAIVRNPFARIESEFRFRRGLRPRSRRNTRPDELPPEPGSFADWLRYALGHSAEHPYLFDNHLRPQHEFVGPATEVFRLEDGLAPVFEHLSRVTGRKITAHARRLQASTPLDIHWTQADRALVREFYASDFETFGYDT